MDLSVIIPVYNEEENLPQLLDSLKNQSLEEENFEIIMIDSNSEDNSKEIIRSFQEQMKNLSLIDYPEPVGPYPPRNVGIEEAENEILVFIDGDCILDRGVLEAYYSAFNERDIVAATGRSDIISDSKMWEVIQEKHDYDSENSSDHLFNTRNAGVLKEIAQELGGFNEEFYRGGDEEFGERVKENGYDVKFLKEAVVKHKPDRGVIEELKVTFKQGKGEFIRDKDRDEVTIIPELVKINFLPAQIMITAAILILQPILLLPYLVSLLAFYHWRSEFYTQKPYRNTSFRIAYFTLFSKASSLGYLKKYLSP